jgi:hypothetical protein
MPTWARMTPTKRQRQRQRRGREAALVQLGFSLDTAASGLTAARAHVEPNAPLELLIKEALRHCRQVRVSVCPRGHERGRRQRSVAVPRQGRLSSDTAICR